MTCDKSGRTCDKSGRTCDKSGRTCDKLGSAKPRRPVVTPFFGGQKNSKYFKDFKDFKERGTGPTLTGGPLPAKMENRKQKSCFPFVGNQWPIKKESPRPGQWTRTKQRDRSTNGGKTDELRAVDIVPRPDGPAQITEPGHGREVLRNELRTSKRNHQNGHFMPGLFGEGAAQWVYLPRMRERYRRPQNRRCQILRRH